LALTRSRAQFEFLRQGRFEVSRQDPELPDCIPFGTSTTNESETQFTGGIGTRRGYWMVGDSPITGASIYGDHQYALSATGVGEFFIKRAVI